MGAAGLTCTTCEQAAAGGESVGMDINLDKVPLREADMEAFEIMMSESQERMLGVVAQGREAEIIAIFERWNTHAVPIGTVTDDGMITVRRLGEVVAQISAQSLVESPLYHLPSEEPAYFAQKQGFDFNSIPQPQNYGEVLLRCFRLPISLPKNGFTSNTTIWCKSTPWCALARGRRGGFAPARFPKRQRSGGQGRLQLALCVSRPVYGRSNRHRRVRAQPGLRGRGAGGRHRLPVLWQSRKPDRFWQFKRSIEGITEACTHFRLPVVSGNVSLYNETPESVIHPSPLIGMVGVLQNVEQAMEMRFRDAGDLILLAGSSLDELGGSNISGRCTVWKKENLRISIWGRNLMCSASRSRRFGAVW